MSLPINTKQASVGDRVVYTDEYGYEYEGVVKGADSDSLDIVFDDGEAGWESRSACVVVEEGAE